MCLRDDIHGWDDCSLRLRKVPAHITGPVSPPLWSTSFSLPRDAYIEYFFLDPATGERLLDPLNSQTVSNGFGARNNFIYMPRGTPTPLIQRRSGIPHGTVTRFMLPAEFLAEDGLREVHLYAPPVKEKVPLLAVYDGTDFLQRGKLANIVDNLIAEKRIRPLAIAFLQNGGRHRSVEYMSSDAVIHWLENAVLPLAREKLNLLNVRRSPGAFGVLGASLGAAMALHTALRMPEIFGRVICQSGWFGGVVGRDRTWFSGADWRDLTSVDLLRCGHVRDRLKLWLEVGRLDSLLAENRRMRLLLKRYGYDLTYREFNAGHSYTAWRDNVWRALEAFFPA